MLSTEQPPLEYLPAAVPSEVVECGCGLALEGSEERSVTDQDLEEP